MKFYKTFPTFVPSIDEVPRKLGLAFAWLLIMLGLFLATSQTTSPQAAMVPATAPMDGVFPIIPAEGDQRAPALVYNSMNNQYLMAYLDSGDVAAVRLLSDGTPLDPRIVAEAVDRPDIDVTFNVNTEEYLVVWRQVTEEFDSSIHGRRVWSSGEPVGDRIDVAVRPGRQRAPAVAMCSDAYLVVWDEDEDASAPWDFYVWGQPVSGDGLLIGEPRRISADPGLQQVDADIVCRSQLSETLVVFRDARDFWKGSGSNDDIYGQRVSCIGEPMTAHDLPISTQFSEPPGGNKQNVPAVAYSSRHDQYLVVWQDMRNEPDVHTDPNYYDIYGQIMRGNGTAKSSNFAITVAEGNQRLVNVASRRWSHEYLVVWEDHRGADADIYAQRVSNCGTLLGEEIIISNTPGDQLAPAVAYNDETDEYLIVWEDYRDQSTNGIDLYGRLYQPPEWNTSYLPLIHRACPASLPSAAGERARAWLDQQTNHFWSADAIPGYNRNNCSGQVARYKEEQVVCQPAVPGDALVSADYCNYGTPDQRDFLGRYGRAFLYDQALGAIAWLMDGEPEKARRLLDYLSSYQNWNIPMPGAANGSFGFSFNTVGCPAYAPNNRDSYYDLNYLRSGAIAWAGYAFVFYQRLTGEARYLDVARRAAEYLLTQQVTEPEDPRYGLLRGGHGSYNTTTWEFIPGQVEWVSTEHNVDAYFFLRDLGELSGDERYSFAAQQIRDGLLTKLWNEEKGRLDRGLDAAGQPDGVDALDAASWGGIFLLAAGEEEKAIRSLAYAEQMYRNEADGIWGYKPYTGTVEGINWDGVPAVWSEGSLGVAMAYAKMGDTASLCRARSILNQMANLQERDPAGGLLYMVNSGDELAGFPRVPSVGGTTWLLMTLRALEDSATLNSFWGLTP